MKYILVVQGIDFIVVLLAILSILHNLTANPTATEMFSRRTI